MERHTRTWRPAAFASLVMLVLSVTGAAFAWAGTSGKLSGRVVDDHKQPLQGVNVIVVGQPLGAASDAEGRFTIVNIPAGRIQVKASQIGHRPTLVQNIDISADQTTTLDIELVETAVAMAEVVVSARRPVVEIHRTSNIASVTREQIAALPVQELQDVVNLQAGVVDGHFRGGRTGEVQYQVDGVSVNNAFNNASTLKLDRSLLEEVQVISGTFDAEYGQAMSGVVNAILKRGGEKFHWDAEVFSGGYVFPGADRIVSDNIHPAALQNFQVNVSGPAPLAKTFYLLSARHSVSDDYLRATRRFDPLVPHDSTSKVTLNLRATGDSADVPLGYTHDWSGIAKITNRSISNVELSYQMLLNVTDARAAKWAFRFDPEGQTKQHTLSFVQGMDLTHTLSKTTFYTLSVRQNYTDYKDLAYDNVYDPRYDQAGKLESNDNFELGAWYQGVDFSRFHQKTNGAILKASFVDQVSRERQLKFGGEFQAPHVAFGAPGTLVLNSQNGTQAITRVIDAPEYPGVKEYRPFIGAAFAQQELEWNDLTFRGGLRFEYFDARSTVPSDLANPANAIAGAPRSTLRSVDPKYSLAPRLGLSYPINKNAALFFAYGHFYQFPGLGQIFTNADYSKLANLQASSNNFGVMGNPDIKPERTVQYQFGYKQALSEYLGLDVSTYYKDIRDLLGVQFIDTYNDATYARLTNVDFGNVIGLTVTLDQRAKGLFSSTIDYTWQVAQGNSSDPSETATRASAGEDPRPRSVPFNWDQRHTLNMTLMWSRPKQWSVSTILRAASGQPYTPTITSGFSGGLTQNSGAKPNAFLMDLRADHSFVTRQGTGSLFARVFNVLDTRYFNGFVFNDTNSPYYTAFGASTQRALLNDPTRYYGPRRIEVGLTFSARN